MIHMSHCRHVCTRSAFDGAEAKLGTMPKDQELLDAIEVHNLEPPRPKGWLLTVVDGVYKEGAWATCAVCGLPATSHELRQAKMPQGR